MVNKMKRFLNWLKHNILLLLVIVVLIAVSVLVVRIIDLKKENNSLAKQVETLTIEKDKNFDLVIERNNELYNCRMEADEWRELFYSAIDFHPDESYPYH